MQTESNTFEKRAARLGHDIAALKAGKTVTTKLTVKDFDHLKFILNDDTSNQENADNAASLLTPLSKIAGTSEDDLRSSANQHIYGSAELSQNDKELLNSDFPLQVLVVSTKNVVYDQPTTLGVSQPPMIFNYSTVTINDGACININNTELQYTADTVIRNGNPPKGLGDINIFGVNANNGSPGFSGSRGVNGAPGAPGSNGSNATSGSHASNALPSLPAIINITGNIQCNNGGKLTVYTASGAGGNGGDGGRGGDGGDGNRAAGGIGGHGGNGGNASNGVDAQGNVMVYVNIDLVDKVVAEYGDAPFGQFGKKGAGGQGGNGVPQRAPNGTDGVDGTAATHSGNHANIIIRPY